MVTTAAIFSTRYFLQTNTITATPWTCVGGCGAGGSGGASGATAKWIGKGASGGLLDVQVMYSSSATSRKSTANGVETRFSIKPSYTSSLALTLPIMSKNGTMQVSTADDEKPGLMNNGLGDIRLDYINTLGVEGNFSYNVTLAVPTGDYTATTGKEKAKQYLPSNLQIGSGLYSLTLDLGYTKDYDDAMIFVDAIYSHPFAINFSGKNQYFKKYDDKATWDLTSSDQKKRFAYFFKPYGENDLGAYTPPSVTLSAFYGYKGLENFVHSFGLMFSAPIGVAWIPDFNATTYNPKPDPDNMAWMATLCYGLEFSKPNFPIFIATYLPIHGKTASATNAQLADPYDTKPMATWHAPDFNDVLKRWSVFIGTKTTLF
jgi:hypothetical protein